MRPRSGLKMALAWIRSITNVQTAYVHLLLPSSTYPHTLSLFSLSHVSSTWHQPTAYFSPDCYQKKLTPFLMLAKLRILLSIKKRRKERKSALGVRCAYDAGVTFSKKILSTRTSATEMAPPTLPTFANARTACGWQGMPSHAPTKREYKASGRSQRSGWSFGGEEEGRQVATSGDLSLSRRGLEWRLCYKRRAVASCDLLFTAGWVGAEWTRGAVCLRDTRRLCVPSVSRPRRSRGAMRGVCPIDGPSCEMPGTWQGFFFLLSLSL